jgi:tRNA-uridine 2-sulfurtransferase
VDCTQGENLKNYLECLKNARFGRGKGYNPCTECKIFIFSHSKKFLDKYDVIATGEVLGQRPMSQTKDRKNIIDREIGFQLLRPLSAKELPTTKYEKKGLVDREKLFGIVGRNRNTQIEIAKKYKIEYPSPAGGCLLCEKKLKNRFKTLIEKNLINEETIKLIKIGRHFIIEDNWYIVARNEKEGEIICSYKNSTEGFKKTPSIYSQISCRNTIELLQKAYSGKAKKEERDIFEKFKL